MGFFNFLIKRILYKIPLKVLLIITIALLLVFLFYNNVFAYSTSFDYNNTTYTYTIKDYWWNKLITLDEYVSGNYYFFAVEDNGNLLCYFYPKNADIKLYSTDINHFYCNNYAYNFVFYQLDNYDHIYKGFENSTMARAKYRETSGTWHNGVQTTTWWNSYTTAPVYTNNTYTTLFYGGSFTNPFIIDTTTISDWSFDNLVINLGSATGEWIENGVIYQPNWWILEIDYQGVTYTIDLTDYFTTYNGSSGESIITIPKNQLSNYFNIRNGNDISFSLIHYLQRGSISFEAYGLGSYTFSLTSEQEEEINSDSDKQILGSIDSGINNLNNTQKQTNNKIDNLQNTLTDSNVDDMSTQFTNLSNGFSVQDPSGLEQIFQKLYNAFCSDEIQDITFIVPFTNKTCTISTTTISSNFPTQITSIVSVFVWGVVGLWVLKDIRSIINKIAEGRVEEVGSDVKKEVL